MKRFKVLIEGEGIKWLEGEDIYNAFINQDIKENNWNKEDYIPSYYESYGNFRYTILKTLKQRR